MAIRTATMCCFVILAAGTAPADEKDDKVKTARAEAEKLDGTWTATAGTRDGKPLTKDELAKLSLTLAGPKPNNPFGSTTSLAAYLPEGAQNAAAVTWSIDPGAAPREITFARQHGARVSLYPGIYELKDDTLTVCADFTSSPDGPPMRKRPAKFEAPKGSPYTLLTFTRAKP